MLFVDLIRYKRKFLSEERREFLVRLIPLSQFVQQQICNKAFYTNKPTKNGVYASLIAAHIILKSQWGEHPAAQALFNSQPANNLALLETHKYWKKLKIVVDGIEYRSFKNYREFAVELSDEIGWHEENRGLLLLGSLDEQIAYFAKQEKNIIKYSDQIRGIIVDLGLREFDFSDQG